MNTVFFENAGQGVVVARISDVWYLLMNNIEKRFPELSPGGIYEVLKKANIPQTLVGKARCNLEVDDYDFETGREIANYRVVQKFNAALTRAYSYLLKYFSDGLMLSKSMCIKYAQSLDAEDRYRNY